MSTDTPVLGAGITLREYTDRLLLEVDKRYEQRFVAQELATKAALASAQLAVDKSEREAARWRDSANEWRAAMSDKDRLLCTKAEIIPRLEKMDEALTELRTVRDIAIGKTSQTAVIVVGMGTIIGIVLGLVSLFGGT